MKKLTILSIIFLCFVCSNVLASEAASPYLKILNKDSNIDRMPLLLTTIDADISGLVVEVKVTQIYKNYGDVTLEGQYVFPGSRRAAVHKVTMKVGDRVLNAEIQEKKQARRTYQKAKSEGKTTSLLEQQDPGLFTMRVANILPDDEIEVQLIYTERLIPENGKYTFSYPAIGIPSVFNNKKGQAHIKNDKEMGFDMIINIDSPIAIDDIYSLNHKVDIEYFNENQASIALDVNETLNFKDDFVIEYSLLGNKINSGVLVYDDVENQQGYFLAMIEPPKKFEPDDLVAKEYILVVDSSGSMDGPPLEMAKRVSKKLLSELKPNELFNVVLFAGGSKLLSKHSMSPSKSNINMAMNMVDISSAGGGTNLLSAIKKVLEIPTTESYSRSLIVLTDGGIDVSGETLDLIRKNNDKQNIFAIGVSQYNNDLPAIEGIAQAGNGQEFIIADENKLASMEEAFLDYVRYPLLTDVKVELLGFNSVDIQPTSLPDLFSQRPVFMTGRFDLQNKGSLQINGITGNGRYLKVLDLARNKSQKSNEAIKYLWAKEKIMALGDGYLYDYEENKPAINTITQLGLNYNLLTEYTSFVAVDDVVRNKQAALKVGNLSTPTAQVESLYSTGYGYIEPQNPLNTKKQLPQLLSHQPLITANHTFLSKDEVKNRPSITFILGKDKHLNNQYYASAEKIFKSNKNYKTDFVITQLTSISEVKNYLKTHGYSTWGIINIVTHSSPWSGLSVKLNQQDDLILDVFSLNKVVMSNNFKPLDDTVLDFNTEIRLLGCSLGKHQQLLKTLSVYFGGQDFNRPTIKSPNDFVYMETQDNQIKTFKNGFALINPNHKNNVEEILALLIKKNPQIQITNLKNWKQKSVEIATNIDSFKNSNASSAINLAKSQKNIQAYLDELGADWDDFKWYKSTKNNQIEIVGKALLMTQIIKTIDPDKLTVLNLNDALSTTIVRPSIN